MVEEVLDCRLRKMESIDAEEFGPIGASGGGVFCSGNIGGELKFESPVTLSAKEFLEAPKEFLEVSILVFDGLLYAATCLVFLFVCAL